MEKRGKHLNIFDINWKKPPTLAEITLKLTEDVDDLSGYLSGYSNVVNWISDGIKAQNDQ
jgi:hypothetical protein